MSKFLVVILLALTLAGCAGHRPPPTSGGFWGYTTTTTPPPETALYQGTTLNQALRYCDKAAAAFLAAGSTSVAMALTPQVTASWGQRLPNPMVGSDEQLIELYLLAASDKSSPLHAALSPHEACVMEYLTPRPGDHHPLAQLTSLRAVPLQTWEVRAGNAFTYAAAAQALARGACSFPNSYYKLEGWRTGGHHLLCVDVATGMLLQTIYLERRIERSWRHSWQLACTPTSFVPTGKLPGLVHTCIPPRAYATLQQQVGTGQPAHCPQGVHTLPNGQIACRR